MEFVRSSRRIRMLNLVSLIDIIFTMILFFMVAGHMEKFAIIPLDLPEAQAGQLLDEGPVEVILGRHHEVIINDTLVEASVLSQELKQQFAHNPKRIVTIKADAALQANELVGFLEAIRAAGGSNISLVTQSATVRVQ